MKNILLLLLAMTVGQFVMAREPAKAISEKDLINTITATSSKPAILRMGIKTRDEKLYVATPGHELEVRFESTIFLLVSNLDGLLADVCDPSDAYWKAWRLVAEGDKDGKLALENANLAVAQAKQQLDALTNDFQKTPQNADQAKAVEIELKRRQLVLNEALKAQTTLKAQIEDAKKLVRRGFKDLSGNFRLRLGGETFGLLKPEEVASCISTEKSLYMICFNLRETNKDKDAWLRLLKNSPLTSVSCDVRLAYINSVGAETVLSTDPTLHLRIPLFRWPFWMSFSIIGLCLYVFVRNVRTTEILRDTGITLLNIEPSSQNYWLQHRHPLSMARLQMSIWFFIIIGSFVFLWSTTGSLAGVNTTALALMGISGGTTMFSAIISQKQEWDSHERMPSGKSGTILTDWFIDLLSDNQGITIHRFQMLAWTLVLSIVFINGVITDYAMPVFSTDLLGLMGISSGVYVGLKLKEDGHATATDEADPIESKPDKPSKKPKA